MEGKCRRCRHLADDPVSLERMLPGLLALSSASGDSRGDQGVCLEHGQMVLPWYSCPRFEEERAEE